MFSHLAYKRKSTPNFDILSQRRVVTVDFIIHNSFLQRNTEVTFVYTCRSKVEKSLRKIM